MGRASNFGRSIMFGLGESLKKASPAIFDLGSNTAEAAKSISETVTDIRKSKNKINTLLSKLPEGGELAKAYDSVQPWKDLKYTWKTGKIDRPKTAKEMNDMFNFGDDGDLGFDMSDLDLSDLPSPEEAMRGVSKDSGDSDKVTASVGAAEIEAINAGTKATVAIGAKTAEGIANLNTSILDGNALMSKSFMATNKTNVVLAKQAATLQQVLHKQSMENMKVMNENLGKLVDFNVNSMTKFTSASLEYYTSSLTELQKISAALERGFPVKQDNYKSYEGTMGKLGLGEGRAIDVKAYMSHVGKNIWDNTPLGTMITPETIKGFGSNIPGLLTSIVADRILNEKSFQKALKGLDSTISNVIPMLLGRLGKLSDSIDPGTPEWLKMIAGFFGIKPQSATRNLGNYEKGRVDFDGITHKTINTVIPRYLSEIVRLLGGNEKHFNYDTGKFEDIHEIEENERRTKQRHIDNAMTYEVREKLDRAKSTFKFTGEEEKEFDSLLQNAIAKLADQGYFEFNPKGGKWQEEYKKLTDDKRMQAFLYSALGKNTAGLTTGEKARMASLGLHAKDEEARYNSNLDANDISNTLYDDFRKKKIKTYGKYISKSDRRRQKFNQLTREWEFDPTKSAYEESTNTETKNTGRNSILTMQPKDLKALTFDFNEVTRRIDTTNEILKGISYDTGFITRVMSMGGGSGGGGKRKGGFKKLFEELQANKAAKSTSSSGIISTISSTAEKEDYIIGADEEGRLSWGAYNTDMADESDLLEELIDPDRRDSLAKTLAKAEGKLEDNIGEDIKDEKTKESVLAKFTRWLRSPLTAVAEAISGIDKTIYDLVFGDDENGSVLKTIINNISSSFSKMWKALKTNFIDPLVKELFDNGGILHNLGRDIRDAFRGDLNEDSNKYENGLLSWAFNFGREDENEIKAEDQKNAVPSMARGGTIDSRAVPWMKKLTGGRGRFIWANDGEKIIPADENPDNPTRASDTKEKMAMEEARSRRSLIGALFGKGAYDGYDPEMDLIGMKQGYAMSANQKQLMGLVNAGKIAYEEAREIVAKNETVEKLEEISQNTKDTSEGIENINKENKEAKKEVGLWGKIKNEVNGLTKGIFGNLINHLFGVSDVDAKGNKKTISGQVTDVLVKGMSKFSNSFFGTDINGEEALGQYKDEIKTKLPKGVATGLVAGTGLALASGGGFGILGSLFLPGGPIGSMILGMGVGLISQSDGLKKMLFGEYNEAEGGRTGGIIPKSVINFFEKNKKTILGGATFGLLQHVTGVSVVGSLLSLIPGGGAIGLLPAMGVGLVGPVVASTAGALALRSEAVQNALFGKEDENGNKVGGLMNKQIMGNLKERFPTMLAGGAIGGALSIAQYGILGSMFIGPSSAVMLGALTGFALHSQKFQEALFGKWDEGKQQFVKGGLVDRLKNVVTAEVINPITNFMELEFAKSRKWFHKSILMPIAEAMTPYKLFLKSGFKFLKKQFDNTIGKITGRIESVFGFVLKPLRKALGYLVDGIRSATNKLFHGIFDVARALIAAPIKILTAPAKMLGTYYRNFGTEEEKQAMRESDENIAAKRAKYENEDANYLNEINARIDARNNFTKEARANGYAATEDQLAARTNERLAEIAAKNANTVEKIQEDVSDIRNAQISDSETGRKLLENKGLTGAVRDSATGTVWRPIQEANGPKKGLDANSILAEREVQKDRETLKNIETNTGETADGIAGTSKAITGFWSNLKNYVWPLIAGIAGAAGYLISIAGFAKSIYNFLTGKTTEHDSRFTRDLAGVAVRSGAGKGFTNWLDKKIGRKLGKNFGTYINEGGAEAILKNKGLTGAVRDSATGTVFRPIQENKGMIGEAVSELKDKATSKLESMYKSLKGLATAAVEKLPKVKELTKLISESTIATICKKFKDIIKGFAIEHMGKIAGRFASANARTASAIGTGGLALIAFGAYDAYTGFTDASEMFQIAPDKVTADMRLACMVLNVIMGLPGFVYFDLVCEGLYLASSAITDDPINIKRKILLHIYDIISNVSGGGGSEEIAKLEKENKAAYDKYLDEEFKAYASEKNIDVSSKDKYDAAREKWANSGNAKSYGEFVHSQNENYHPMLDAIRSTSVGKWLLGGNNETTGEYENGAVQNFRDFFTGNDKTGEKSIFGKIAGVVSDIGDSLVSTYKWFTKKPFDEKLVDIWTFLIGGEDPDGYYEHGIIPKAFGAVGDVLNSVWSGFSSAANAIGNWFANTFERKANDEEKAIAAATMAFDVMVGEDGPKEENVSLWDEMCKSGANLTKTLTGIWDSYIKPITELVIDPAKPLSAIGKFLTAILDPNWDANKDNPLKQLRDSLSKLGDSITNKFNSVIGWIKDVKPSELFGNFISWLVPDKLKDAVTRTGQEINKETQGKYNTGGSGVLGSFGEDAEGADDHFTQGDSRWANKRILDGTMEDIGCGPTALATAMRHLGVHTNPLAAARHITSGDMPTDGSRGVTPAYFEHAAAEMGGSFIPIDTNDPKALAKAIQSGYSVIAGGISNNGVNAPFTTAGHYTTLHGGFMKNGTLYANSLDPLGKNRAFRISDILSGVNAGGPSVLGVVAPYGTRADRRGYVSRMRAGRGDENYVFQGDWVSDDGARPETMTAMSKLGDWFKEKTGHKLVVTAVTNGDHSDGEYSHANGWKVDVNDWGGPEGLRYGWLYRDDNVPGPLAEDFEKYGNSLGLGMNFEKDHFDVSAHGDQWAPKLADGSTGNIGGIKSSGSYSSKSSSGGVFDIFSKIGQMSKDFATAVLSGKTYTGSTFDDSGSRGWGGSFGSAPAAEIIKGDNAKTIWKYLTEKCGFSPAAAAGIMGNLEAESELDPSRVQGGGSFTNINPSAIDGKTGFGLAQWTYPSRVEGLKAYASQRGTNDNDIGTQLEYLWQEANDRMDVTSFSNSSSSPANAAETWMNEFEKPNAADAHLDRRQGSAQAFYNEFATGGAGPVLGAEYGSISDRFVTRSTTEGETAIIRAIRSLDIKSEVNQMVELLGTIARNQHNISGGMGAGAAATASSMQIPSTPQYPKMPNPPKGGTGQSSRRGSSGNNNYSEIHNKNMRIAAGGDFAAS